MDIGIGNLIGTIGDKILPKELQFLGHIAGGVADFYTGNYAAMVKDGMDAFKDFPFDKIFGSSAGKPPSGIEPPPPSGGKTSGTSGTSGTSSSSSSTKADPTKEFFKLSDADFMKSITGGKVPDDVMNDPKSMLQLQARMNHIAEMNALMSNMMKAMHDMRMAVVNNIRV